MPKVMEESYQISSVDTGRLTIANATASKWSDMWKYQVPTGEAIILKPGHHFSIYLDTSTGSSEATPAGTPRIKIEVRDQSEQDAKGVFGPRIYASCKTFDDVTKMATLDLQSDMSVEEKFWIVVMVYHTTQVLYSDSYFELEAVRVRSGI